MFSLVTHFSKSFFTASKIKISLRLRFLFAILILPSVINFTIIQFCLIDNQSDFGTPLGKGTQSMATHEKMIIDEQYFSYEKFIWSLLTEARQHKLPMEIIGSEIS
jgi:hypothetical protein